MIIETLHKAAKAGAAELVKYFNTPSLVVNVKDGGINDLVTEADHASDKAIIAAIKESFPDHFILSEETGNIETDSNYKWVIDPIDGTINYAHGIPICCVSIGVENDGEIIAGVRYNPFMNEYFFAEKGKGAFLNDMRITVSTQRSVLKSCLVTGFPYSYLNEENGPLQCFERLVKKGVPVRRLGSAALDLCWVASGRFDGFYEHKLKAWDTAAGVIILKEAGGHITDFNNSDYSIYQPKLVATNGIIHDELISVINDAHPGFKL